MAIAQSIIDLALATAKKAGAEKIVRVNVVAGELRGIVPMQLTFCFSVAAENTLACNAQLSLEITPVRARCRECEESFDVKEHLYMCPKCQSRDVQTISGTELKLRDIEVE